MTGIILQARMGSTRLPGKVLKELCGRPMLGHILDRLRRVRNASTIVVATSAKAEDDAIETFCSSEGVACFRGDELDVLDRYYRAALCYRLDNIVRATADNPFVDPEEMERLISLHAQKSADYTHAFGELPIGVGAECFTFKALERSWQEGRLHNHREHVNEYIQDNPGIFLIETLKIPAVKKAPGLRLTVDTPEDFARAAAIYGLLYRPGRVITTEEAIKACAI